MSALKQARQFEQGATSSETGEHEFRAPATRLLRAVARMAKARAAALRLLDEASGELRLIASVDTPPTLNSRTIRISEDCGVCDDALRKDSARCAAADCACAREFVAEETTGEERIFVLPLHYRNAPCGVLILFFASACEVPDSISALLPAIGDMLGLALENSRLAERTLQHGLLKERQMLAGEIHDSLAQSLTWMRMRTVMLRDSINCRDETRAKQYLAEIEESLTMAHSRVRELITEFRVQMDSPDLVRAIDRVVSSLNRLGGVHLEFENRLDDARLGAEQELEIFHIVREALANIVKHAKARRGRLTMERREDSYQITVEDDGVGLPYGDVHDKRGDSYGMSIMRERAHRLGGSIEFGRCAQRGTSVKLCIPRNASDSSLPK